MCWMTGAHHKDMYLDMAKKEGLCSLLSVPMMVRDKAVGVFTSEEVKLLQAIANQAAIAIEHTTLIEKSHEMQEALAVRKLMNGPRVTRCARRN